MSLEVLEHIYTVSELTKDIKEIVETSFPSVWVEGEISNLRQPLSGHKYFTLKDEKAQLNCAFFKYVNKSIKFQVEDGLKIVAFGRIGVYEKTGQYQLYVEKIEPKGLGALQLRFEQLKNRLKKEGLFEDSHKVSIPTLPTRIGVVTSPAGAAVRDILNVLSRRFTNVTVILNPVSVQGNEAPAQIAGAIEEFNNLESLSEGKIKDIDVMIVTRGGGSLEDLWAFNEEIVARAIYNSKIPVISAVGHEIDWTISDFVADLRSPTPSAAAEMVIAQKEQLTEQIRTNLSRLNSSMLAKLELLKAQVKNLADSYCFKKPQNLIEQCQQKIDDFLKDLSVSMEHKINSSEQHFRRLTGKMEALSPLAILNRGYSITRKYPDKGILKDIKTLKRNELVYTRLSRGSFISKVTEVEDGRDKV